jgi:hypothetical protein
MAAATVLANEGSMARGDTAASDEAAAADPDAGITRAVESSTEKMMVNDAFLTFIVYIFLRALRVLRGKNQLF